MIEFGFLFWLFFIGIVVAVLQDLKRREVDDWLNLFLLVVSFSFVVFRAIFEGDSSVFFRVGFALVFLFVIVNVFYYGHVFAGGDANLLFAMTIFFVGASFYLTLVNIVIFILFLMVAGSVYGSVYSLVLYFKDFRKVNKEIIYGVKKLGIWSWILSLVLVLAGFLNFIFFFFGIFLFFFFGFYVFAKGLEVVSMVRIVSGKDLREGDWLVDDVKVGKKIIKADWDGLSSENIELLRNKKKVKIKEGLPFVPAFLIAFLSYVFLRGWLISFFFGFN